MEIIKHGDLQPVLFECQRCGCEFVAELNEYKAGYFNSEKHLIVNCPDCNNVTYVLERKAMFVTIQN